VTLSYSSAVQYTIYNVETKRCHTDNASYTLPTAETRITDLLTVVGIEEPVFEPVLDFSSYEWSRARVLTPSALLLEIIIYPATLREDEALSVLKRMRDNAPEPVVIDAEPADMLPAVIPAGSTGAFDTIEEASTEDHPEAEVRRDDAQRDAVVTDLAGRLPVSRPPARRQPQRRRKGR